MRITQGTHLRHRLTGATITVVSVDAFTRRVNVTDGVHSWSEAQIDLERDWQVVPTQSAADLEAEGQGRLM